MGGTIETFKPRFAGDTEAGQLKERVADLETELSRVKKQANSFKDVDWTILGQPMSVEQAVKSLVKECNLLKDQFSDYKEQLWCALGQPLNVEYIQAVKELVAEREQLRLTQLKDGQALCEQAPISAETQEQIKQRKKGIEWLGSLLAGLHWTPDYAMEILMREQKALAELVPVRWKQ
jgi:archaellum component FlaC